MKATIKIVLISFILFILGIGLGYYILGNKEESQTSSNNVLEELVQSEKEKVDSLTLEIGKRENIINQLKDSIKNIKVVRIYKVDSIRKLPTTEGVEFLKLKLREFESKYREE